MHHRPSSLGRTCFRRIIVNAHFAALIILFVAGIPSAQAASQVAYSSKASGACPYDYDTIPAKALSYTPQRVKGDAEFNGHGPSVTVAATLYVGDEGSTITRSGRGKIDVKIYMRAQETQSDWTEATGTSDFQRLYTAPSGCFISNIEQGGFDSNGYLDTNHRVDRVSPGHSSSFVSRYEVVGDIVGKEAGTKTRVTVYTKAMHVELK